MTYQLGVFQCLSPAYQSGIIPSFYALSLNSDESVAHPEPKLNLVELVLLYREHLRQASSYKCQLAAASSSSSLQVGCSLQI